MGTEAANKALQRIESEITERLGVFPAFYRASESSPQLLVHLWKYAKLAFLDNPLPSLFKEKVFAYLSRFTDAHYCLYRRSAFLLGYGYAAGDRSVVPLSEAAVLELLREPLQTPNQIEALLQRLEKNPPAAAPLESHEKIIFWLLPPLFLHERLPIYPVQEIRAALRALLGQDRYEWLRVLLAFINTRHFWVSSHPEIDPEGDVQQMLEDHPPLASWLHRYRRTVAGELHTATMIRIQRAEAKVERVEERYDALWAQFRALAAAEREARAVLEAAPDAMLIVDEAGLILQGNRQAERIFGYPLDELFKQPVEVLLPERFRSNHIGHRQRYQQQPHVRSMGMGMDLFGLRKDGTEFPVEVSLSPHQSPEGMRIIAAVRDISERKEADEHQRLLMAELDHRVKNVLNLVSSIAKQSLRRADGLDAFRESFLGRISALAEVHRLLTANRWRGIFLNEIIQLSTKPHDEQGERVSWDGAELLLPAKPAQSLYLVLHELATNAAKYGGFSRAGGGVSISWRVDLDEDGGQRLHLSWVERGGPTVAAPETAGFGTRLIERIVTFELKGQLTRTFAPTGLVVELNFPLRFQDRWRVQDGPRTQPSAGALRDA